MTLRMIPAIAALLLLVFQGPVTAQQKFTAPDVSKLKHLTTQMSDHAPDIPGKETQMDFYSAPEGQIITVYTYKAKQLRSVFIQIVTFKRLTDCSSILWAIIFFRKLTPESNGSFLAGRDKGTTQI